MPCGHQAKKKLIFAADSADNEENAGFFDSRYFKMTMSYMDRPIQIGERWWKAGETQKSWPEAFLRARESTCITACDRFLNANFLHDSIWLLSNGGLSPRALLMQSRRTLFPVLGGQGTIPVPLFLKRFLLSTPVHAVQGLSEDVSVVERALVPLGYMPTVRVDFFLMACAEGGERPAPARRGLLVRPAKKTDYDALLDMQINYEMEEVTTNPGRYRPESARASLARILQQETVLVTEYQGTVVGKINTNARSFTRRQLGGVYVKPPYRRMGVASAMVSAMKDKLNRKSLSLYVRKANKPAMLVYDAAGFKTIADYRITYFSPAQN